MAFRYFSICKNSDHTSVDENIIDKLVCDKFGFTYSEEDYGHFFFTETEAKEFHHQKSISWVGLIDWIIWHSFIGYGRRNNYEVEAAHAWTRQYVGMPESTVHFLSDLLEYFKENGYYIFVRAHDYRESDENFFRNTYQEQRVYESESGLFMCDDDGKLLRFFPAKENLLDKVVVREHYTYNVAYYQPCVKTLIIPEGITSFAEEFFCEGYVQDFVSLPESLHSIGNEMNYNVFAGAHLPEIIIPKNVNMIGAFAFGNSIIRSVKFTRIFKCEYLRQFKGAHIEALYLPQECQQQWQQGFDGYTFLHEANNVEFY